MRIRLWFALICLGGAGFGCGSAPVAPTFTLDSRMPKSVPAPAVLPVSLGVSRVQAPVVYARRSVMWREGSQLGYYTTATWSDTPQDLLTDTLVQMARSHGGFAEVRRLSSGYGALPDLVIHARIEAFEAALRPGGRDARIALHVAITDGAGQEVLWEGLVEESEPVKSDRVEDLLSAFAVAQQAVVRKMIDRARQVAEDGSFDRYVDRNTRAD